MIKYPHIKKKCTAHKKLSVPRFDNCAVTQYTNHMKSYYVMCQKGSSIHRAYVQLDPESADILHDSLEQRHDLVQVSDVPNSEIDSALLL